LQLQRKLTTHQKAVLIQVLRTFPDERVSIRYSRSASDAHSYAQDFLSVFRAIGWDVSGPEPVDATIAQPSGLELIADAAALTPCVEALRDALRIYDIEAVAKPADAGSGRFVLNVGLAPGGTLPRLD
jgi:hypothetical protein